VAGYAMRQFTHSTANRVKCRATALIETNALLLDYILLLAAGRNRHTALGLHSKADDTHSNKLRQYYGATLLRHNIARLS